MYYDIRNVGYEYLLAERCLQAKEYEQAIAHYKAAIANYEYADNEYILHPDHEYTMVELGVETHYPSPRFMEADAEKKIDLLKRKYPSPRFMREDAEKKINLLKRKNNGKEISKERNKQCWSLLERLLRFLK